MSLKGRESQDHDIPPYDKIDMEPVGKFSCEKPGACGLLGLHRTHHVSIIKRGTTCHTLLERARVDGTSDFPDGTGFSKEID